MLRKTTAKYEILIVVYGGSTDNTIDIVKKISKKNKKVKLLIQPKDKKGVGYAKIMAFKSARYPYVFYADADNQFDLKEFEKFLPYIGKYDVIAGYRIKRHDPKTRIIVSNIYNMVMRMISGAKERDLDCAFRLVSKKVINSITLKCRTGVATTELLAKARKKGFRIKEIGVHHYPRRFGQTVFESGFLNFPKPKVIKEIIKEMKMLYRDLK